MVSRFYFIVVLCLTSGLLMGTRAEDAEEDDGDDDNDDDGGDQCCKRCPDGWASHDDKCYQFHFEQKSWAEAEKFCTSIGGNLASLDTDDALTFLQDSVKRVTGSNTNTWLGGCDAAQEGVWLWSSGLEFKNAPWAKGEPNNYGDKENCMAMNYKEQNYLNDADCSKEKSFICARDMEKSSQ